LIPAPTAARSAWWEPVIEMMDAGEVFGRIVLTP
jgi:hypothetical protein